jgi:hypothetical protein
MKWYDPYDRLLIVIAIIAAAAIFAGCVEEIPEPKYVPCDIIAEQPTDEDCLMTIISYNKDTDEYEVGFIHRNKDGSWGHFINEDTSWYDREFLEEYMPTLIAHVGKTQIRIMDVDVTTVGLSQLKVDMTIRNVGDTTAKNVIASVITAYDEHIDDVLNSSALLRIYTEDGVRCLDREYLGDIEPDQYAKASLLINPDDLSEGRTIIKAATADNAEAVYY